MSGIKIPMISTKIMYGIDCRWSTAVLKPAGPLSAFEFV
jgi:hypothetical protein